LLKQQLMTIRRKTVIRAERLRKETLNAALKTMTLKHFTI